MTRYFLSISRFCRGVRLRLRRSLAQPLSISSLRTEEQGLMIEALYVSPSVMAQGMIACVLASVACYANSLDRVYLYFITAFVAAGLYRIFLARDYKYNAERRSYKEWRSAAITSGVLQGLMLGLFAAYAISTDNHFNELIAFCIMLGNLVAIPSRNFSSKRLINYQMIIIGTPVICAMLIQGNWQYWVLAAFFLPMFISMSQLATQSRRTLLQVIHRKAEIKELLSRFDTATNFMQHGFLIIDEQDEIIVANSRALLLLGVENTGDWVGKTYQELLEHAVKLNRLSPTACEQLSTMGLSSRSAVGTHKVIAQTNSFAFVESSVSFCEGQLVVLLEDVTDRIHTADRITYMATHDSLTGLCNREHFHDLFKQHLRQGVDGRCMLAVVDLDEFKHINDTYGHAAGDELLCSAASNIEQICGEFAVASRFGGDEFVIFAPHIETDVDEFLNALTKALNSKVQLSHCTIQSKASVGVVVEQRAKASSDAMFAMADIALYESKAKARGEWTLFDENMDADNRERQLLKDDLAIAMENDDLSVVFQPIVNLESRRISTFEALSRWNHPERGEISPSVFIPLAEEMGVIGDITLLVLRKAARACRDWPGDVGVSVNLSAIDFDNPNLTKEIDKILWSTKLRPDRLEVEITEGTFVENKKRVANAVVELRKLGVRIALDDFGTGYSNFSYLQEVNLNKLKIDRCFVNDILENHRSALLLSGISDIAKRLEMSVTVEGIETEEQLIAVNNIANVDNVQGWVFSKAVTPEQAIALVDHTFDIPPLAKPGEIAPLQRSA